MKVRKILALVLAFAMIMSTMSFAAFAKEADDIAMLAGYTTYVKDLQSAFTPEVNADGKQVLLVNNWTGDVDINYPGLYTSFYLNGYTMKGQLKLTDLSTLTFYGIEPGNDEAGTDSKITASGIDGDYTIYQTSGANLNITGAMTIEATETDGIAIYADNGKVAISNDNTVVNGNVKAMNPAIIKITGGTFKGNFEAETPTNLEITGGKFAVDPSEFLPAGYTAVLDADNMYSIIEPPASLDDLTFENGSYVLSDAEDVKIFREVMSKENIPADAHFVLANDIDMSGITLSAAGNDTYRFYGIFDGNDCTISNITINGGSDSYVAFFGNTSGATLKNLTLENIIVNGGEYTAGLVGRTRSTIIENCKVIGDIDITGTSHVGGIVGGGVINLTNCAVTGNEGSSITGTWDVGGIAGLVSAGSSAIEKSNISNININAPDGYVGGVAGRVLANAAGNNFSLSHNTMSNTSIISGDTYGGSALLVGKTITGGKGAITYKDNTATESGILVDGVESNVLYAEVENETNVNIPVAKIGSEYYYTLAEAIKAAGDNTTIYLLASIEEGSIKLPAKITNLTIDGQGIAVVKNTTINAYDGGSINYQGLTIKNTVFDNSRFVLNGQRSNGVIYKNIVFEGNTFKNLVDGVALAAVHMNIGSKDNEYIENFRFADNVIDGVTGTSCSGVVIKQFKGDVIFENNTITNVNWNAIQCMFAKPGVNFIIRNNTLSSGADEGVVNLNGVSAVTLENNTINTYEGQPEIAYFNTVAENGNKKYSNLSAAIADGGEIDILADAEISSIKGKKDYVVDLNGHTLTAIGNFNWEFANLTIKNGTLNLNNANASDSMFTLTGNDHLVFDNVKIIKENYVDFTCYIINLQHKGNGVVEINNSEVIIGKQSCGYDFIINHDGSVSVNNSKIVSEAENIFGYGGFTITDTVIDAPNATLVWHAGKDMTINGNSEVDVKYIYFNANATLTVADTASVKANIIRLYDRSAGNGALVVGENATVTSESVDEAIINNAKSDIDGTMVSMADAIEVEFVNPVADETSITYDIALKAIKSETINRLNSADLTFALTQKTGKNIYEIVDIADDNITFNPVYNVADGSIIDGRYEFHFETKTGVENDTDNTIVIAKVKFTGYGEFGFGVKSADTNVVHATTLEDNIVETYVPNGDTTSIAEGELVIDNDFSAEIAIPRRALTVKVSFPNGVNENDAAYQNMTLSVVGDGVNVTEKLGYGLQKDANGVVYYTEVFGDTILNTPYTVTLEGAGYRTVKYTVNMTEAKTLNFWNNVKDNEVYVEESASGVKKYAQKVTFLAGDIVKDNNINVYDLSAVVSYFGEIDLSKNNKPEYAKYDLNRDGKIDSKDVAYVLVSWGN